MIRRDARGFTLPELVVALCILLVLGLAATMLLRPKTYDAELRDAQRRTDMAQILITLRSYAAEHDGILPIQVPDKPTVIGSEEDQIDLCAHLVPNYLKDIPLEPLSGAKDSEEPPEEENPSCNQKGIHYISGYLISRTKEGVLVLESPLAERGRDKVVVKLMQ